jgi:rhodanese-related sulfurtransferase
MLNPSSQNTGTFLRDPHISRAELRARLSDKDLAIIDVMPRETFRDGHIPRSLNLPLSEIAGRARGLLPDLSQEIAIYCASPT